MSAPTDRGSWATTPAVLRSMRANRSRDTRPELAVRRAAHRLGLRYRVNSRPLPGLRRTADMVFSGAKVAVFIDGCYWHGCPDHYRAPSSNREYWSNKVSANKRRDRAIDDVLRQAGWAVVRVWEHNDPEQIAQGLVQLVRRRQNRARMREVTPPHSER